MFVARHVALDQCARDQVESNGRMMFYRHSARVQAAAAAEAGSHLPALAERHDLVAVPTALPAAIPAAWPTGASQLAIAHDVVRRGNNVEVRSDWVAPAR